MGQTIEPLTEKERNWVHSQLEGAAHFIAAYSPEDQGRELTLAAMDRAWAAWLSTEETDSSLVNAAINVVGAGFGQTLVDNLPFEWVIATDAHGSDLAVHALPGRGDVLLFPANFVAKRYERRESQFLQDACNQVRKQIDELLKANPPIKPWWRFW